jgi:hypothetical protein
MGRFVSNRHREVQADRALLAHARGLGLPHLAEIQNPIDPSNLRERIENTKS